ncbi:hypothetical protein D9611_014448 [Ephemerocybe angulata]|uniref:Uncharacterized protein n=1 Tax=Ephemerocybe angulata TaxID=980116 RepID=A0A8H5ARQ4_9AGAR|nr:hypothetical protein D9611_014448 [Tulosesus angulatus]
MGQRISSLINEYGSGESCFFMTDITINRTDGFYDEPGESLSLGELHLFETPSLMERKSFPLTGVSRLQWEIRDAIEIPAKVDGIECIVKSKEAFDVAHVHLDCRKMRAEQSGHRYSCTIDTFGARMQLTLSWILIEIPSESRLTSDDAELAGRLNDEAISLTRRYEQTGELSDIDKAIASLEKAIELTFHGSINLPVRLNNLGTAYKCRFERLGELPVEWGDSEMQSPERTCQTR